MDLNIPAIDPAFAGGLLIFGLILKIVGFTIRDELKLRVLVATGLTCDALFYLLRAEPIAISVAANVLLVSVNVVLVILIVFERTTWRMTAADRILYSHFKTLSPGQFRRLRRTMRDTDVPPDTTLVREGKPVDDLMLVFADRILIGKSGAAFPITGPAFVGEIAFLTGARSSADVCLPAGGRVVRIDIATLNRRIAKAPALKNAMVALFGQELARKVAYSVPMPLAAGPPDAPPASPTIADHQP